MKVSRNITQAKYRASSKGKAMMARYQISSKAKAAFGRYHITAKYKVKQSRYRESPKGRATTKEWRAEWLQSPRGKAYRAGQKANHRARSTNPALYAARVELVHIFRESCAICSKFYQSDFQVDHIIALCNGGKDDWDNLQPICFDCHKLKTRRDLVIYNSRGAP